MNLLKIARVPAIQVAPETSVIDTVDKMVEARVGAVAVVENGKLVGIFTERDLMERLVHKKMSTLNTQVKEVMTANPETAPVEMNPKEAINFMLDKHFRHLPVIDENGQLKGMLSARHLMHGVATALSHELDGLNAYIAADGIGG